MKVSIFLIHPVMIYSSCSPTVIAIRRVKKMLFLHQVGWYLFNFYGGMPMLEIGDLGAFFRHNFASTPYRDVIFNHFWWFFKIQKTVYRNKHFKIVWFWTQKNGHNKVREHFSDINRNEKRRNRSISFFKLVQCMTLLMCLSKIFRLRKVCYIWQWKRVIHPYEEEIENTFLFSDKF